MELGGFLARGLDVRALLSFPRGERQRDPSSLEIKVVAVSLESSGVIDLQPQLSKRRG